MRIPLHPERWVLDPVAVETAPVELEPGGDVGGVGFYGVHLGVGDPVIPLRFLQDVGGDDHLLGDAAHVATPLDQQVDGDGGDPPEELDAPVQDWEHEGGDEVVGGRAGKRKDLLVVNFFVS